ncbi:hypothetical protein [Bdellovibrio bacteriovorus]|uniref:hypothetical protein n=1 Tax=Bdellovibrio bacteriovorus TaxID=959 RepID=UPI0035A5EEDD
MKLVSWWVLLSLSLSLVGCFSKQEKAPEPVSSGKTTVSVLPPKKNSTEPAKDKALEAFARYFEQADAIHREAWWVLTEERRPAGKSPFGKVQRALLSSQNIKLSNKSMFRCDRYLVKRDIMGLSGYPQKAEVFEKCSEKTPAKLLAEFSAPSVSEVQVTFFPDGLEEVLGLGATVLNKRSQCTLKGNEKGQLVSLQCKDWAQDRNQTQMIRLDVYDYSKEGKKSDQTARQSL